MTAVVEAIKRHALIVDVSTLDSLADINQPGIDNEFIGIDEDPDRVLAIARRSVEKSRTFQQYLMFLESLVLFDALLFDRYAAITAGVEIRPELSPFVQGIDVPTIIYHNAAVAVEQAQSKLRDETTPPGIRSLTNLSGDPFWGSPGEK